MLVNWHWEWAVGGEGEGLQHLGKDLGVTLGMEGVDPAAVMHTRPRPHNTALGCLLALLGQLLSWYGSKETHRWPQGLC